MANGSTSLAHPAPGNGVSAHFHINLDRTQVVNYAEWRSREAIATAGADPNVTARIREAAQVADGFRPILYELRHSWRPVSENN
jgi:hypothetical protein